MGDVIKDFYNKTSFIIVKASTGLIIFFLIDLIVSATPKFFCSYKDLEIFKLSKELYKFLNTADNISIYTKILILYILLWGWGHIIHALRQIIFHDQTKGKFEDYLGGSLKEIFKELKRETVNKIKKERLLDFDVEKICRSERYYNGSSCNDYILFNLLKDKVKVNYRRYNEEADFIAYLGINIILFLLVMFVYYGFYEYRIKNCYIYVLFLISIIITIYFTTLKFIGKRYAYRNLQIYLKFLNKIRPS